MVAHLAIILKLFFRDWKLTRLLSLISLAHQATGLPFSLAEEQNLLASVNQAWVFSCPAWAPVNKLVIANARKWYE